MPASLRVLFFSLLAIVAASGCSSTHIPIPPGEIPQGRPVTAEEEAYGHEVLTELQQQYELDYNDPRLDQIQKIVDRLTHAAGVDKDPWHVFLFKSPETKNAAATRGNHVFVWSGLLNSVSSDDELSVIIAHELSHVLAGHTDPDPNEEVKKILISVGAIAAGVAVSAATNNPYFSADLGNLTSAATEQLGAGLAINPYAKQLEFEADTIGLMLMAEAKFDPQAADTFWSKATNDPDFQSGPAFFSTHPPTQERLENIRARMPLALARYRGEYRPVPGEGDTFDFSGQVPSTGTIPQRLESRPVLTSGGLPDDRLVGGPRPRNRRGEEWQIVAGGTKLYRSSDEASGAIGEFRRGAKVTVIGHSRGWLEVVAPDHGFLRGRDAEPAAVQIR